MRKIASVTLCFLLIFLSSCGVQKKTVQTEQAESSIANITVEDLKKISESDRDIFLLDVRTQSEFDNGHLSFVDMLIPYDSLELYIEKLPKDKETEIYSYCRGGGRSMIASKFLISKGYKNVFNILGGIMAWEDAGYEVVTE